MVKGWDKFDEVKMGVIVRHIRRWVGRFCFGSWFTLNLALLYLIPCLTPGSVNSSPLSRKDRSKPRCVACKGMVTSLLTVGPSPQPAEKTNVSPDLPAPKKLRYALQWTFHVTPSCFDATSERPSYNLSSELTTPSAQAVKPAENGTLSIPYTPNTAVVVTPAPAPAPVYSVDIKDPTSIKSQLPFKESVAVATGTSVP